MYFINFYFIKDKLQNKESIGPEDDYEEVEEENDDGYEDDQFSEDSY